MMSLLVNSCSIYCSLGIGIDEKFESDEFTAFDKGLFLLLNFSLSKYVLYTKKILQKLFGVFQQYSWCNHCYVNDSHGG